MGCAAAPPPACWCRSCRFSKLLSLLGPAEDAAEGICEEGSELAAELGMEPGTDVAALLFRECAERGPFATLAREGMCLRSIASGFVGLALWSSVRKTAGEAATATTLSRWSVKV